MAATTGAIAERAMLVDLTTKMWGARKVDGRATAAVATNYGNLPSWVRASKCLVDPVHLDPLRKIAAAAADEARRRTLPWVDGGARILSAEGYFGFAGKMREFEIQWEAALADFIAGYPGYVAEAKQALNGLYNGYEYPGQDALEKRFSFTYNILPFPDAKDFRVELGQVETARMKTQLQATIDEAMAATTQECVERISEVVGHMAGKLRAYDATGDKVKGIFRDTLVDNVKELVDILPSLNLTNNDTVASLTNTMREALCSVTAADLRTNEELRNTTAKAAEDILQQMGELYA